jgi:uncharacterized protein (DUF983 family)
MKEPGKLIATITNRCPSCHQGELFDQSNPYSSGFMKMKPHCENCGCDFKREPGFYFGAAYVSYGLTVALWISCIVALYTFDAIGLITYAMFDKPVLTLVVGFSALILLLPVLYRLSRSIWIHMFVSRKTI